MGHFVRSFLFQFFIYTQNFLALNKTAIPLNDPYKWSSRLIKRKIDDDNSRWWQNCWFDHSQILLLYLFLQQLLYLWYLSWLLYWYCCYALRSLYYYMKALFWIRIYSIQVLLFLSYFLKYTPFNQYIRLNSLNLSHLTNTST